MQSRFFATLRMTLLLLAVFGGCAYAWMGDMNGSPAPVSGASAAVAAPLRDYSVAPLGGHSL